MFGVIYGSFLLLVAVVSVILVGRVNDTRFTAIVGIVLGTVLLFTGTRNVASPQFNKPLQPTRLESGDTLYVAPQHGDEGFALIAYKDSLGREVVRVIGFVAEHKVPPIVR